MRTTFVVLASIGLLGTPATALGDLPPETELGDATPSEPLLYCDITTYLLCQLLWLVGDVLDLVRPLLETLLDIVALLYDTILPVYGDARSTLCDAVAQVHPVCTP